MTSTITVPAAARSVIAATPQTTFQVGTYTTLTDTFTKVVDLNDHVNFWLVNADLAQPKKVYARTSTIRVAGERITNWNYQNRHVTVTLQLLYESGTATLLAAVRTLLAAIENPPYRLAFAAPNSTVLTYADVVAVTHTIPYDGKAILAQTLSKITIDFECAPGFSGDRITLQNLVVNPGFEAPAGSAVSVFDDPLANVNAYTVVTGSAPFVNTAGTMNIPSGTLITFGSPAWGPINRWQARMFFTTGLTAYFYCHYTDANNKVFFQVSGSAIQLWQVVAGVGTQLATLSVTLTNSNYYWIVLTQFPAAPGSVPYLTATLVADSGGTPSGATIGTLSAPAVDAAAGLTGLLGIDASGAQLSIGGTSVSHSNQVSLFGPGGWLCVPDDSGVAGNSAGAWDTNTANTYTGGATTSYGAARMDFPPAGATGIRWDTYNGGTPGSTTSGIIAASAGQTVAASVWMKTSPGISATCAMHLILLEYDSTGAHLRSTGLQVVTGPHTSWTQLSGTLTLGTSTAYIDVQLYAGDATAGASANGTIWWDNVQCYNQTTTGQTTMPYCELRFHQSPAQLLVTGVQGDLPAPAHLAWGTFLTSWLLGATLSFAIGRRAQASANAQLCGVSHGFYGTGLSPQSTATLDAASYGGFYPTTTVNPGWNPRAFSFAPADALGVYHLFNRYYTAQTANLGTDVGVRVVTQQRTQAWYGLTNQNDQIGAYDGPWNYPISAASTWTAVDAGQVNVPALPVGALTDLTQNYLTPRPQWEDLNAGGAVARCNWQLLLPVDGGVLVGSFINPSNAPFSVVNQWLWGYLDGLLIALDAYNNGETLGEGPTCSLETTALPNAGRAGGGAGTTGTGAININTLADSYLTLDPNVTAAAVSGTPTAAGGSGVNQLAGYIADNAGAVLPLHVEVQYSPLYLYPRQS